MVKDSSEETTNDIAVGQAKGLHAFQAEGTAYTKA